jgi:hypothetical protein
MFTLIRNLLTEGRRDIDDPLAKMSFSDLLRHSHNESNLDESGQFIDPSEHNGKAYTCEFDLDNDGTYAMSVLQ